MKTIVNPANTSSPRQNPEITRRLLLQTSTAVAALALDVRADDAGAEVFPALDAHTHFYDPTRPQGVPWPGKQDRLLYRKVMPDELRELTQKLGVRSTIAVEASPWLEDNQWLLDLAAKNPFVVGVVGHLDPASDEFPRHLKRFAGDPLFRGIRVNHQDLLKGLEDKTYLANLGRLITQDLELDVNGGPAMPADVALLSKVLPDLRIVINHVGNVLIDGKPVPPDWRDGMRKAAGGGRVFCKVSALVDGTRRRNGDAPIDVEFYRPVLDAVWDAFGEDRLIYASNWPVCLNAASYATVHRIVDRYVRMRGKAAAGKFFLHNALAAYKPPRRAGT